MNILVAILAIAAIILLITGGVVPTLNFLLWVGIVLLVIAAIVFLVRYLEREPHGLIQRNARQGAGGLRAARSFDAVSGFVARAVAGFVPGWPAAAYADPWEPCITETPAPRSASRTGHSRT